MTELVTPRLRLRPASPEDLEAMHAIMSDARAMRYWSTPPHIKLEQTREWLASMIAIPLDAGEDFIVEHDGEVIGKAGLYRFPEIGFIFDPAHWGRGFAREALTAVVERAFAAHRLPRVTADVDPRNTGSLRLLKGLGFREVGRATRTWQVGEEWCDSIYLSLEPTSAG